MIIHYGDKILYNKYAESLKAQIFKELVAPHKYAHGRQKRKTQARVILILVVWMKFVRNVKFIKLEPNVSVAESNQVLSRPNLS